MESGSRRRPKYTGEDTSPTTERELQGWYSYGIAAEVFAISGLGSFLPVTLEQLAREYGVLRNDGITSCVAPTAAATKDLLIRSVVSLAARDATKGEDNACVVHILGATINTSSFALYTSSLAVLVQALVLISISAIADHGGLALRILPTSILISNRRELQEEVSDPTSMARSCVVHAIHLHIPQHVPSRTHPDNHKRHLSR